MMDQYQSPLSLRYASKEMSFLFSNKHRFTTWRRLWVSLAKGQKLLGLKIEENQILELEAHIDFFDWDRLNILEKKLQHDVMAHIEAFGELAPSAKGILHLGATSCYVTDNGDLIIMREALIQLEEKLLDVLKILAKFAQKYASLSTVSYTHFQPAQPTTVGKRACLWLQDLLIDLKYLQKMKEELPFFGVKGATGTQASFLTLFEGDPKKILELEKKIANNFGFTKILAIGSQTYTRKIDQLILDVLGGIAASAHKCATDLRLLAHMKEIFEPFEKEQVGSSAMPHKKNPIYAERICGLARFLISLKENPSYTLANQWLERSLDDSSNRRIVLPEAFLCADAICLLLNQIFSKITVNECQIREHFEEEHLPLSIENLLMVGVKRGGDRQVLHAELRKIIPKLPKKDIGECASLILNETTLPLSRFEIETILNKESSSGLAELQVHTFLAEEVFPILSDVL